MTFADHFSGHATDYAKSRPSYPAELFYWLAAESPTTDLGRVGRPGALLALWCYTLFRVDSRVGAIVDELYGPILGDYWPPRRDHIETEYRELELPFAPVPAPRFFMRCVWTADQVLAYLGTWSSVRRYVVARGADPLARIATRLRDAWGEGPREVAWQVHLRTGRV